MELNIYNLSKLYNPNKYNIIKRTLLSAWGVVFFFIFFSLF